DLFIALLLVRVELAEELGDVWHGITPRVELLEGERLLVRTTAGDGHAGRVRGGGRGSFRHGAEWRRGTRGMSSVEKRGQGKLNRLGGAVIAHRNHALDCADGRRSQVKVA